MHARVSLLLWAASLGAAGREICRQQTTSAPEELFRQALCYSESGDPERAAAVARRYVALRPQSADGYALLGTALIGVAPLEEARQALQRALTLDPHHRQAVVALAGVEFASGRFERAASLLAGLAGSDPANDDALVLLAEALLKTGRAQGASALLVERLQRNPVPAVELYVLAARAYLALEEPEKAAAVCEKGLVMYPTSEALEAAYFSLAPDLLARRLAQWLDRVQREASPRHLVALGRVLSDGDPGRKTRALSIARGLLERAVAMAPRDPLVHYVYGRAFREDAPDLALKSWEKALELGPGPELCVEIYTQKAALHAARSEFAAAEQAFQAALEQNRALRMVQPQAALEYARFLYQHHKFPEAEAVVEGVLRWRPLYPPARLERARLFERQKRWAEAIREAEFVLSHSEDNPPLARQAHLVLARAYRFAGDLEKSRRHVAWLEAH
jgi:tetratricopeptide (TPR) repeat protein